MLHSPCPMVVTLHDLAALKRRSEHLRTGVRLRLRQLAVQRAVHVIVPTQALAQDAFARLGLEPERVVVIPEAPDAVMQPRSGRPDRRDVGRASSCPSATCCGSAASSIPIRASTSPSSPPPRASCRSCSSAPPVRGRTSSPT